MADLIRFPRPNRPASNPPADRSAADQRMLNMLRELREMGMDVAEKLTEQARRGDLKALTGLSRITDEVCEIIALEEQIASGQTGRRRSKSRTRRPPRLT